VLDVFDKKKLFLAGNFFLCLVIKTLDPDLHSA